MADITPLASLHGELTLTAALTGELAMPEKVWMQGPPGAAATVKVGTVTTGEPGTDAIVTNSGTESAAVFDFTIPRGETGAEGPAGAGVPDGGTVGQLLSKTESGTAWTDPPQSGVQPDWNQNDETQPDYVKNRPFYTGNPVETVLVEESTVTFEDADDFYLGVLESAFSATIGETYKVSWDGTTYECTCVNFNAMLVIGNLSIAHAGTDTGEPFVMLVTNGVEIKIGTTDTSASHTLSISGTVAPIVKIPAKYIDKNSSGYVVIHSKRTMTQQEAENYQDEILRNEVAFIIWNGMCISEIWFGGMTSIDLQFTTQNGASYFIKKNAGGLFDLYDRKFNHASLPNGLMTGDDAPTITVYREKIGIRAGVIHSGVGSTDALFQVDPNGTKSKAFDVLGNGEAVTPALILYSSTADSTKQFRITVDDTGTLTATEVTS